MAKTRRIIRKLKLPVGQTFDDQLWPVVLALCVLAGFVMGSVLARLEVNDPRWYANAVTWLIVTLLATAGAAVALWKLDNRRFRRSMQLAILLGLFLHVAFFVATLDLYVFSRWLDHSMRRDDLAENRQQVTVPDYVEMPRPDETRPDFERPVEAPVPETPPDRQQLTRQQVEPQQRVQIPQPTPVPEPEETPRPSVIRREPAAATTPRYSDRRSQLSRRMTDSRPTPPSTHAAEAPTQPALARSAELQAQDSTPRRQPATAEPAARRTADEPSTSQPRPDVQMARRADQQIPEPQDSAVPTFRRPLSEPLAAPRTAVDLADVPAVSAATDPHELRPSTTLAQRQATASPRPVQTRAEPVPDAPTDASAQPQRRQAPTESRPDVARTPIAVPNQRTRTTPRPDPATTASRVTPGPTSPVPQPEPPLPEPVTDSRLDLQAATAPVTRATASSDATRPEPTVAEPAARDLAVATLPPMQRSDTETSPAPPVAPAVSAPSARTPSIPSPTLDMARIAPPATVAADAGSPAAEPQPRSAPATRQALAVGPVVQIPEVPSPPVETPPVPAPRIEVARAAPRTSPAAISPAAAAPAAAPRRAAESPSPAADTAADTPQAPAIAAAAPGSSTTAPAASRVAVSRRTPPGPAPAAPSPDALAGVPTPVTGSEATVETPAATRSPRGPEAPQVAQSNVSSSAPRQLRTALPSATTIQADLPVNLAATRTPSDQPQPSSATVARQTLDRPSAQRSQQAMEAQVASARTRVARPTRPRIESTATPSVTPAADPAPRPSRASLTSPIAASPTPVESPAVAAARQGASEPVAAPARMAMSRSVTGTAGVGAGRNLDRARPAEDSPSLTATASARRAEPVQEAPQGPALSPAAPALVRRSTAGNTVPSASLPAEPLTELTTAADQLTELAASASSVQRRSDAKAAEGPVTADRGTTEVDLGVTRIVSEGQVGRASGGGQPVLSFEIDSPHLARSERVGGAPLAALAEPTVVDVPTAPPSSGGGQPPAPHTELPPTAVVRTDPGGASPVSGGPSRSTETGPPTEVSMATRVADALIRRAELSEAAPGNPAAGGGEEDEDEEERKRRLVRAASRLAATTGSTTVELPRLSGASDGDQRPEAAPAAVSVARADAVHTADASVGSAAEAGPGEATAVEVAEAAVGRAAATEATPEGPPVAATAAATPRRSPGASTAPAVQARAEPIELPASEEASTTALAAASTQTTRDPAGSSSTAAPRTPLAAPESDILHDAVAMPTATTRAAHDAQPEVAMSAAVDAPARRTPGGALPPITLAAAEVATGREPTASGPTPGVSSASAADTALARSPATEAQTDDGAPTSSLAPEVSGGDLLAAADLTRAEAVDAAPGSPDIGGGTQAPTRAARGPLLTTNPRAETLQIAGMPQSGGLPDGSPIAAQGLQPARRPAGADAVPAAGPVGAADDPDTRDAPALAAAGAAVASRSASPSTADGPVVSQDLPGTLPFDRTGPDRLPFLSAAVTAVDLPDWSGDEALLQAALDHQLHGLAEELSVSRQTVEGGLTVNLDAPPGLGGLGPEQAPDTGLNHRRAATDSVQVQVQTARFVRQQPGGRPDFSTAAIVATEPFQRRADRSRGDGAYGDRGAPSPRTEEAIELGLAYLARIQLEDGSWSLQSGGDSAILVADTAATGLALLAFQGAGYNHREHRYADVVNAGIQHLIRNQKPDGDLFLPLDDESNRSVWIYSHSIAALALSEAYGMTQDPALREPAQKAIGFLVASQHPERGGWRYSPRFGSDTSVTGWAMMALKSGELANLDVPQEAYDRIRQWLDKAQASPNDPHLYVYNPLAPDTPEQRHGRRPNTTMTSVGLLMRLYLGWHRDYENMVRGAEYLAQNLPQLGSARNPKRDTYYWYYATQVMFHMGGDYWQAWNAQLHPLLVDHQIRQGPLAGSWDPRRPVPDRWALHAGRVYVTTMNLLSLEVYYRYLPLYEHTAR